MSSIDLKIEEETGDIILYHGTSDYYLDDIKKDGLSGSYPDVELLRLIQKYLPIFLEYKNLVTYHTNQTTNLGISGAYIQEFLNRQKTSNIKLFFTKSLEVAYAFSGANTTIGEGPSQFLKIFNGLIMSKREFVNIEYKRKDDKGVVYNATYFYTFEDFIKTGLYIYTLTPTNPINYDFFDKEYNNEHTYNMYNFTNDNGQNLRDYFSHKWKDLINVFSKLYMDIYNTNGGIPELIKNFFTLPEQEKKQHVDIIFNFIIGDLLILQEKYNKMTESQGIILAYKFKITDFKNNKSKKFDRGNGFSFMLKNVYPYEIVFTEKFLPEELYICVNCKDIIPQTIKEHIEKNKDAQNYPSTEEFRARENSYRNRVNLLPLTQIGKKIIKIKSNITGRIYIR